MRRDELGHGLPDPGADLKALGEEGVDALVAAHDAGVLQGAREEQVVGRSALDADAHAGLVDVGQRRQRRALGNSEHALDQDVGCREGDLGLPRRFDGQEAQVGIAGQQRLVGLSRRVEAHEPHRNVEPRGNLARDVDGDAGRFGRCALSQHRIAEIDRGTQQAARREVLGRRTRERHDREPNELRRTRPPRQWPSCRFCTQAVAFGVNVAATPTPITSAAMRATVRARRRRVAGSPIAGRISRRAVFAASVR